MGYFLRHPSSGLYYTQWDIDRYAALPDDPMSREEAIEELGQDGFEIVWCEDLEPNFDELTAALQDGISRIIEVSQQVGIRKVETPYYTKEEAAEYLRTTVDGIYGRVERRQLERCVGVHGYLFTKEMLDDSALGRVRKPSRVRRRQAQ